MEKIFPNNCIIAGLPAKIVRKDIAWNRSITDSMLINDINYWNLTEEDTVKDI